MESKLAGTRQLWNVMTSQVPTPVPAPVRSMRAARETCQMCHWAEKVHGDKLKMIREYADDETSSETVTTLQLHVGGGREAFGSGTGIHWHMNLDNVVEFASTDNDRQVIPYVRVRTSRGEVREFVAKGADAAALRREPLHRMDCVDCHNRPAHTFSATPDRALDEAIARVAADSGEADLSIIGYCMGGPMAFRTAVAVPDRVGAVASFHGGGLVTDMPSSPHLLAPKIKARMYFGVAANDDMQQPDAKTKLKEASNSRSVASFMSLSKSSSVSPGKPTMKSVDRLMSGRMALSLRIVLLYSSAV